MDGGLRRDKLILGMPMYGQSFTLASVSNNGLNAKSYGGGTAGQFTRARGFLAYYEICDLVQNKGWKLIQVNNLLLICAFEKSLYLIFIYIYMQIFL